jgi:hypothetical protein
VRHLSIDGYFANEALRTVLSFCPNISDLAILYEFTPYEQARWTYLLPIVQEIPHLNRLTLGSLCVLSYRESLVRTFLSLTHLTIHGALGCSWGEWEVVTRLPKLTHLNVEMYWPRSHLEAPPTLSPFKTLGPLLLLQL